MIDVKYTIEKDKDGNTVLVTNQKYKDDYICLKIDSIIKSLTIQVQNILTDTCEAFWIISYEAESEEFFISLMIEQFVFKEEIDINLLLSELVEAMFESRLLETCSYLNEKINNVYQLAFYRYLNYGRCIYSDIPVNCYATITTDGKEKGFCSRIVIGFNEFKILEYVGQPISNEDVSLKINVYKNNKKSMIHVAEIKNDFSYYSSYTKLGYYLVKGIANDFLNIEESEIDIPTISRLNVSNYIEDGSILMNYLIQNNSEEEIRKYKSSIRPEIQLLNINSLMVKEFCK